MSIFNADLIDTDITATGDVDLSIGGVVDFNEPGNRAVPLVPPMTSMAA